MEPTVQLSPSPAPVLTVSATGKTYAEPVLANVMPAPARGEALALTGIAVAAATGALSGAIAVGWRIRSCIVSLGMLEAARRLAYPLKNSRNAYIGNAFGILSNPIALGVPPAFLVALGVRIGANEEALRLAGVNPQPYKIVGFAFSMFFGVSIISVLAAALAQLGANEPTKCIISSAVIGVAVVLGTYRSRRMRAR